MNREEFTESIALAREEIIKILATSNIHRDKDAKKTLKTIEKMFDRIDKDVDEVIPEELLGNYYEGVDEATKELSKSGMEDLKHGAGTAFAGKKTMDINDSFKTQVHMEAIEAITDDTMQDLKAAIRTAEESSIKTINETLDNVKKDLQEGILKGNERKKTQRRVAETFAKEGMTSFKTVDGKKMRLDFYSEVVTRTNTKIAHSKGAINRQRENGVKLFYLDINDPTCDKCEPRRGIVFTNDPDNDEYPFLDEDEVHPHPNCQCVVIPYVDKFKDQSEIDKDKENSKNYNPYTDNRSQRMKDEYNERQKSNRWNRDTKKQFESYQAVLGEDAPSSLGGFKRSKKSNSDKYKKMQSDYMKAMREARGV